MCSGITRISIFHQADSFGQAGLDGLKLALSFRRYLSLPLSFLPLWRVLWCFGFCSLHSLCHACSMRIHSVGTYPRNTVDIAAGLASVLAVSEPPQAVVMIGTALPLARFVAAALNTTALRNAWFLTVSFVGTEAFQANLIANGVSASVPIFISQVVVSPQDQTVGVAKSYRDAITALYPTDPHTRSVLFCLAFCVFDRP